MFDIGFWELVLVGLIALIVLGPERLPRAARTLGQWTGRARSYVRHFSAELEREVSAQETREKLAALTREVEGKPPAPAAPAEPTKPPTSADTPSDAPTDNPPRD